MPGSLCERVCLLTFRASLTHFSFVFSGEIPFERYHTLLQHNVIKDEPELEESLQEVVLGPEQEEQEESDEDTDDEDEETASPMKVKDKPKKKIGRKRGVKFFHINSMTILAKQASGIPLEPFCLFLQG